MLFTDVGSLCDARTVTLVTAMNWTLPVLLEFFLAAPSAIPLTVPCCSPSLLPLLGGGEGEWVCESGSFAFLLFQFHAGVDVFLAGSGCDGREGQGRRGVGIRDRDEDVSVVVMGVYWDHQTLRQGWTRPSYQIIICCAKLRDQKCHTDW